MPKSPAKKKDLFGGGGNEPSEAEQNKARLQEIDEELDEIKGSMDQLRSIYELYFMGVERTEPVHQRDRVRANIRKLREELRNAKNPRIKFKLQTLQARWVSLENYWGRINRQRENGTYFRDKEHVKRLEAKRKEAEAQQAKEEAAKRKEEALRAPSPQGQVTAPGAGAPEGQAVAVKGSTPTAPRAPARDPSTMNRPSAASADDLSETKLKQIYSAYTKAKQRCGEKLDLRFEDMASSLRKQVPKLLQSTGAKSIEFKVVIKQGRAVLKAVPKD